MDSALPLISSLTPEWTKRVQVLTRLEGVALGIHALQGQGLGSPLLDALNDAAKQLRDPLAKQVSQTFVISSNNFTPLLSPPSPWAVV